MKCPSSFRYIMIAHFNVYKVVYRKGWIALMIVFCWTFALLMLAPTLFQQWGEQERCHNNKL